MYSLPPEAHNNEEIPLFKPATSQSKHQWRIALNRFIHSSKWQFVYIILFLLSTGLIVWCFMAPDLDPTSPIFIGLQCFVVGVMALEIIITLGVTKKAFWNSKSLFFDFLVLVVCFAYFATFGIAPDFHHRHWATLTMIVVRNFVCYIQLITIFKKHRQKLMFQQPVIINDDNVSYPVYGSFDYPPHADTYVTALPVPSAVHAHAAASPTFSPHTPLVHPHPVVQDFGEQIDGI